MDHDYVYRLLRRFKQTIDSLKENWQDDIGLNYVRWLEESANKLEMYESERRQMMEREAEIRKFCEDILEEDNKQKVR